MASAVAMMVGGALVNALAFSGSNYLFSKMGKDGDAGAERERHDKAEEQLQKATTEWNEKRTQRLDFINEEIKKEHHAVNEFDDADTAMKQYYYITGKQLSTLPPKPELSDFYTPSEDQKNREIAFIIVGMSLTGFVAWKFI